MQHAASCQTVVAAAIFSGALVFMFGCGRGTPALDDAAEDAAASAREHPRVARIEDAGEAAARVRALIDEVDARGAWMFDKRWEVAVNAVAPEDMPALLERASEMRSPHARRETQNALVDRWAEEDPAAAVAWASALQPAAARAAALAAAAHGWAYVDAIGAATWAKSLDETDRAIALRAIAAPLGYRDPKLAFELLLATPPLKEDVNTVYAVFRMFALAQPEQAWEEAKRFTGSANTIAKHGVANARAMLDPEAAFAWARDVADPSGSDSLLSAVAGDWASLDPRAAASALAAMPYSQAGYDAAHTFMQVWKQIDAASAAEWESGEGRRLLEPADGGLPPSQPGARRMLAHARSLPPGNERRQLVQQALFALGRFEPAAAWAELESLPAGNEREATRSSILGSWAMRDPDAAYAAIQTLPPSAAREQSTSAYFLALCNQNPDTALARWATLPPEQQERHLSAIASTLAHQDPARLRGLLEGMPDSLKKRNAIRDAAQQLAWTNPQEAMALADQIPDGQQRQAAYHVALQALARQDADAALAMLEKLPSDLDRKNLLVSMSRGLMESDPEMAAEFLEALPPGTARAGFVGELAHSWAAQDVDAALDWAIGLSDANARMAAVGQIASSLQQYDPRAATQLLATLPSSKFQGSHQLSEAVRDWSQHDPQAAAEWANGLGDEVLRGNALKGICQGLLETEPQRAAELAISLQNDGVGGNVLREVLGRWGENDPDALADWALAQTGSERSDAVLSAGAWVLAHRDLDQAISMFEGIEDAGMQAQAVGMIANAWGMRNPEAAHRWLDTLPAGKVRDSGYVSCVTGILVQDPAKAAEMASRIQGNEMRASSIEIIGSHWLRTDRERAIAWLETVDLPPERKVLIMQQASVW
ncbi:MAG: hypothetical protein ACREIA_22280 [Opitutaceae bacterium]